MAASRSGCVGKQRKRNIYAFHSGPPCCTIGITYLRSDTYSIRRAPFGSVCSHVPDVFMSAFWAVFVAARHIRHEEKSRNIQ